MADSEAIAALWATAQDLAVESGWNSGVPMLLFVSDPDRTPDPCAVMERLPEWSGIIYRAFGAPDALQTAQRLMEIARLRRQTVLIGFDAVLAEESAAHGVHLPERALDLGPALRARHSEWILTGAAHGALGLAAAEAAGLDAALLSPVFASNSPSAGRPLGLERFSALAGDAGLPVYALGGVTAATAPALVGSGAAGIAAVEGLL